MSAAAAGLACAASLAGLADAAPPAPIIQAFKITATAGAVRVSATGPAVTGRGTATRLGATGFALRFPAGPGMLSESVARSVRAVDPGCVERLVQTGSFTFEFSPAGRPGFSFGGRGEFSSSRVALLPRRPGGGCRTGRARSVRRLTLDAGATQVFGVG